MPVTRLQMPEHHRGRVLKGPLGDHAHGVQMGKLRLGEACFDSLLQQIFIEHLLQARPHAQPQGLHSVGHRHCQKEAWTGLREHEGGTPH